jgi:hypothetical protein
MAVRRADSCDCTLRDRCHWLGELCVIVCDLFRTAKMG